MKTTPLSKKSAKIDFFKHFTVLKKQIEKITKEEFKRLLDSMSNFHHYSFHNWLLIRSQCPVAVQVASFKKWRRAGRKVKKGEKALWILAPLKFKIKVENESEDEAEIKEGIHFFQVPVFDISQTETKDNKKENRLTSFSPKSLNEIMAFVSATAPELKISFTSLPISLGGDYSREEAEIRLNSNLSKTENTGTLIHELAHHLLGHSSENDSLTTTQEEQEAETLTYLFCKYFGIQRKSDFYLKSWQGIAKDLEKIYNIYKETLKDFSLEKVRQLKLFT